MAKAKVILACTAVFHFPFGNVEVSEEYLCTETIPINVQLFTERLRSTLKRQIPTALSVESVCAFLPDGVRSSGGVFSFEALLRSFTTDLCSMLANYISSNYVPENKIVR